MIELIACRHIARVLFGRPHQLRVERDGAEPVVRAIARNHRLRGGRIELPALREILVESRLVHCGRRRLARAAGKSEQRQRGRDAQHTFGDQRAGHRPSPSQENPRRR